MRDTARELTVLRHALDSQRRHVLTAIEGLTDEQLRRAVLPSGWTVLGLLRHLDLGIERYWFLTVMGGAPLGSWPDPLDGATGPADWHVADDEPASAVVGSYRSAIARSDEVLAGLTPDSPPRFTEPWWDECGMDLRDLRAVLLHATVDVATHAGHLDAVRELIDGRQHLVL